MGDKSKRQSPSELCVQVKQGIQKSCKLVQAKVKACLHRYKCDYCHSTAMGYAHDRQKGKSKADHDGKDYELEEMHNSLATRSPPSRRFGFANTNANHFEDGRGAARRNANSWRRWREPGCSGGSAGGSRTVRAVYQSKSHVSCPGGNVTGEVATAGPSGTVRSRAGGSSPTTAGTPETSSRVRNTIEPVPSPPSFSFPVLPVSVVAAAGRKNGWPQRQSECSPERQQAKQKAEGSGDNNDEYKLPRLSFQSNYSVVPPRKHQREQNRKRRTHYRNDPYAPSATRIGARVAAHRDPNTRQKEAAAPLIMKERKIPVWPAEQWGTFFSPPAASKDTDETAPKTSLICAPLRNGGGMASRNNASTFAANAEASTKAASGKHYSALAVSETTAVSASESGGKSASTTSGVTACNAHMTAGEGSAAEGGQSSATLFSSNGPSSTILSADAAAAAVKVNTTDASTATVASASSASVGADTANCAAAAAAAATGGLEGSKTSGASSGVSEVVSSASTNHTVTDVAPRQSQA